MARPRLMPDIIATATYLGPEGHRYTIGKRYRLELVEGDDGDQAITIVSPFLRSYPTFAEFLREWSQVERIGPHHDHLHVRVDDGRRPDYLGELFNVHPPAPLTPDG